MEFKNKLKELMEEKDITKSELAKESGIPFTTISGWFNDNKLPNYTAIKKLANYFDVTCDYLLGLTDEWGNVQPTSTTLAPKTANKMSEEEKHVLELYNSIDDELKENALVTLEVFAKSSKKANKTLTIS